MSDGDFLNLAKKILIEEEEFMVPVIKLQELIREEKDCFNLNTD